MSYFCWFSLLFICCFSCSFFLMNYKILLYSPTLFTVWHHIQSNIIYSPTSFTVQYQIPLPLHSCTQQHQLRMGGQGQWRSLNCLTDEPTNGPTCMRLKMLSELFTTFIPTQSYFLSGCLSLIFQLRCQNCSQSNLFRHKHANKYHWPVMQ